MSCFRLAIAGGGLAGLCLAAALHQLDPSGELIRVDVYEASPEFVEIGAGLTLWGRVCEALYTLGMAEDCIQASVVVASSSGHKTTTGFTLRDHMEPHTTYGGLPFKDAWSLHRADLLRILVSRVPPHQIHLSKRVTSYSYTPRRSSAFTSDGDEITLSFADGSTRTCDLLVGSDGLRSLIRGKLMRDASEENEEYLKHIPPLFTGTWAYRILMPAAKLAAKHPNHPILSGGQIYMGEAKHVVGYPISPTTLNFAINLTPSFSPPGSPSTLQSPSKSSSPLSVDRSRTLDKKAWVQDVAPKFAGWNKEVEHILECVDSAIEWPVMDVQPLPFYARDRVAIIGDAAHAAVPYVGAGAAFSIEDAFVLSRILYAATAFRSSSSHRTPASVLALALTAYQNTRMPYGSTLVLKARLALRDFQLSGLGGTDAVASARSLIDIFKWVGSMGDHGPLADAEKAVKWFKGQVVAQR